MGVGGGIGFGFGGATCGGGVAGLEELGLLVLAAFWSFANRFSRIYPSLLNIFHDICCGSVYPVSVILRGWTQLAWIRVGAHGCGRDYRRVASRREGNPRASTQQIGLHRPSFSWQRNNIRSAPQASSSNALPSPGMKFQFGIPKRR